MAENPTLYQLVQIGVEVTPGTPVAATKRLTSLEVTPTIKPELKAYRPSGYKFPTISALGKEWTESAIQGPLTYTEIIYLLNSLLVAVTPTGAGPEKTWTFTPSSNASDTRKAFTIETGSADRGRQMSYSRVTSGTFNFSRDECTFQGTITSKALADDFTLTTLTSAAEIKLIPILPTEGSIKLADTYAGLAGATALGRVFSISWGIQNLSGPVWPINSSTTFAALTDLVPTSEGTIKMAVDDEGMALLANLRSGDTKFLRVKYTGVTIGTLPYSLQIDLAMKVSNVQAFSDEAGVYAIEWNFTTTSDVTWGKSVEIIVVNDLTGL